MENFIQIIQKFPDDWNKDKLKQEFSSILQNTILDNTVAEDLKFEVLKVARDLFKMKKMDQRTILNYILTEAKNYTDESDQEIIDDLEDFALDFSTPLISIYKKI